MVRFGGTHRILRYFVLLWLLAGLSGCIAWRWADFREHSYPADFARIPHILNSDGLPSREWVKSIDQATHHLLPPDRNEVLTTDQLNVGGLPIDVWTRFNLHPGQLDDLFLNTRAIEEIKQTVSPSATIDNGHIQRPAWNGFAEIEVPVPGNVVLYARLGVPEKQYEIPGSFVIITHGLFGSLDGLDVINHVQALRRAGHHVLAIEMRGHGQTFYSHDQYAMTFGVAESGDFLAAARWLKQTQGATRVGLVSFSLTGFEAILTAWLDGKTPVTELQNLPLNALLPPHQAEPAFNGGMFIVSAPVDIVAIASHFDQKYNLLQAPVKATFQELVRQRIEHYKLGTGYTMWDLVRCEYPRSDYHTLYPSFEAAQKDLTTFLDLSRDDWMVGASRMDNVRIPVLILNSGNDPLESAQGVASLFARQHNPNIGVLLPKEGGHIGFTAYSADYYYALMINFFDPATAPRGVDPTVQSILPHYSKGPLPAYNTPTYLEQ